MNGRSREGDVKDESAGPVPLALGVDVSSVVTQVTSKQGNLRAPTSFRAASNQPPLRLPSWQERLKSLICCFAPERGGYLKEKRDKVVVRSPPRPTRSQPLLGPKRAEDSEKPTLVLDLDETLVHSSFKPIPNPDYIIPVDIDGKVVDVYVLKRPWLDHFMNSVAERYEVVVFTASLAKYADPLMDMMDKAMIVRWRLFRESCCPYEGNYVKDLSWLGRDLTQTIIVDNSPHSYIFQPQNALPIGTFIDDMEDRELLDMLPVLNKMHNVEDVRLHLSAYAQTSYM
ncbi:hypothetical protein CEUSTIGMA_g9457.t1 [Chlamydomonas eustigma]|uniref:FCP1 homology domain-containing protein n=1 Tax=Chlamydomonas eustigma TaxID=1157962 RepID=A0A250XGJ3_9CHLO|nr:hypothetical protein CEUSTIGMA_g9457.t1 [Chlamydomonas eustigma]|eukprot:GAX82029.1 hypothetical protein CEUSTIGMA_g9457.t1 [Chlamydomonas eustigma]